MSIEVFSNIFNEIDNVVVHTITGNISNVANILSPIFLSAFIVYVLFVFLSYWQGSSPEATMIDLIKRVAVWGLIISLGVNIGNYNNTVVPIVLGLGEGLVQAFNGLGDTSGEALDKLGEQLVDIVVNNNDKANSIPMPFGLGDRIEVIFKNAVIIISFGIFLIVCGSYIILAKVMLAVLAVLGPIFISLALFPATRQFFMSWVNQVVNYSLYLLTVNITAGLFIGYISGDFSGVESDTQTGVIHIALTSFLFFVVVLKLPEFTAGLVGGIANNGFAAAISTLRNIPRGGKGGGKGGDGKKKDSAITPEKDGRKK